MKDKIKNITVFYDGNCPLCNWEISHLKQRDSDKHINFENIHCEQFAAKYPTLNKQNLDDILHVQQSNGQFQTGIDATYLLWDTVGLGKWLAPLKWKWLRPTLKYSYLLFAKYRHKITAVLFAQHHQNKQGSNNE
jgi:predicted DCC family thiol-disulfide oxidoreductase YuxK